MRKTEVPQDNTRMNAGVREIAYAVDENGSYTQVQSLGWEAKDTVNEQAWEVIVSEIVSEIRQIKAGKRSPLAFHMCKNLMNVSLLASYADLPQWRVKRHLRGDIFRKLEPDMRKRYADVFNISVEELEMVPDISDAIYKDEK